jgi:hypothetical protein
VNHSLGFEGAQSVASTKTSRLNPSFRTEEQNVPQPLSRLVVGCVHRVQQGKKRQEISDEQQKAANQAKTLDDHVAVLVFAGLGQGRVDHYTEIKVRDMHKTVDVNTITESFW